MLRRVLALVALAACVSCGGKSAPPVTPSAGVEKPGALAPEPQPDLSPVAAPAELILVGRLSRPKHLIETLVSWGGMPIGVAELMPEYARGLENVIAWDAPVETAAVLDRQSSKKVPPPRIVASIGLTSVDAAVQVAQARGARVTPVAPGVYRVVVAEDLTCAIAVSIGPSPARLVCGDAWPAVEELLPYATRGLPTRDLGPNELHVEFAADPVRRRYQQEISAIRAMAALVLRMARTDAQRLDRVLTDVVYGLADELKALALEVHGMELNGRLDTAGGAFELSYSLALRPPATGERSWLSASLQDAGTRAAPPPDVFWRLPAAAHSGAYSTGTDPNRVGETMRSLVELADAYLEHEKLSPALRKRIRRVLETYPTWFNGSAYVSGASSAASTMALPPELRSFGWYVGAVNARAEKVTATMTELTALLQDREFTKLVRDRLHVDAKLMPKLRTRPVAVKGFPARGTSYVIEVSPELVKRMQDGSKASSAAAPAAPAVKAKGAPPATTYHAVFVPDGERTWFGFGPDQRETTELLEMASGARPAQKLDSIAELAPLREARLVSGGFWTLEAILQSMASALEQDSASLTGTLPNRGRSPWLVRANVTQQAPGVALTANVRLPKQAFEDLGSLLVSLKR